MLPLSFFPEREKPSLARCWLLIGVAALALAGLFSLVLVVARTPALSKMPLFTRLFHESLVVHVNLSVLVWFLAIAAVFWSLLAAAPYRAPYMRIPMLEKCALYAFGGGALVMSLSVLDPGGGALMSNYIPVISNRVFFAGLALIFCGTGLVLLHLFLSRTQQGKSMTVDKALHFAISTGAVITLIALLAFVWAFHRLPPVLEGRQYYEILFWGGGHILQFTHTQMQMMAWLLLAAAVGVTMLPKPGVLFALFAIGPLAALSAMYPFLAYEVTSMEYREFFTQLMIWVNGLGPSALGILLLWALLRRKSAPPGQRALTASLLASFALFIFGGMFGVMIEGQDVTIPAHYHGSIVSVTLAFMGLAYLLLPRFGYAPVAHLRLAFWQPIIYAAGQIMHISGLAWSGGYGALRKTPGTDSLPPEAVAAMGLMGGGGLIAIIGGILFVVAVWIAVTRKP